MVHEHSDIFMLVLGTMRRTRKPVSRTRYASRNKEWVTRRKGRVMSCVLAVGQVYIHKACEIL